MKNNWFSVSRELFSSDLWLEERFTRGQAWVDLIGLANFKDGFIRVRGNRLDIKRGQVGWSIEKLAARWKWSRGKINRWFSELEIDGQIAQQKNRVSSIITIANYEKYQQAVQQIAQQTAQQTEDRQHNRQSPNNNVNKDNKDNNDIETPKKDSTNTTPLWVLENCPDIQKMDEPLTEKQFTLLLEEYPPSVVKEKLIDLGNAPKYLTGKNRRTSTNRTIRSWMGKDGYRTKSSLEALGIHELRRKVDKIHPDQAQLLKRIMANKND